MRILVTGSSGFIGKHLMAALPDAIPCDVDTQSIEGPFDGIIHLAAVSRVRDAEADRIKAMETNILFTAQLLEFKPRWFLFASTCESAQTVYGYTKYAAEDYIRLRHPRHIIARLANVYGPGMAKDKLLPKVREGAAITPAALPFEYVHVDDVVKHIQFLIREFERPDFKPYTLKLASGIAKTEDELRRVAASY